MRLGMSKAVLRPGLPVVDQVAEALVGLLRVPNPANCRSVHSRPRYMLGYTPRVKGYSPGTPIWSCDGRSASV